MHQVLLLAVDTSSFWKPKVKMLFFTDSLSQVCVHHPCKYY